MAKQSFIDGAYESIKAIISPVATDPKHLKPGELVRILNSTPLGEVLRDRRLRTHRERAGNRIGDGKTIDLLRYAAWLAQQPIKHPAIGGISQETIPFAEAYERKKNRERDRNAAASRSGRDVGEIPEVQDPKRRARCERSLEDFCETYYPLQFHLEWSKDHKLAIGMIERAVMEGGLFAFAMPRGTGKTTLCEAACMWAILYGKRHYVVLIGASGDAAKEILESIKTEFETNELLAADFPEVCYPIAKLEGIANRAKGQICNGERTRCEWGAKKIVLPTVAGSKASGAIIQSVGITGRIRGMKHKLADGSTVRPDLVIPDDPQTDRSARSENQCTKRIKTLSGSVLGLAGPGKKIAGFMPCTVIEVGDMADQILDREKYPMWQGMRFKLLYDFPTNMKLWDEYAEIRRNELRNDGNGARATAFYKKNRKAMDLGARVAWELRHNADELSAVQNCMNLFIDNEEAFWAEAQNSPVKEASDDDDLLSATDIAKKVNKFARGLVPNDVTKITAAIDVQHSLLYWIVIAWTEGFGGYILDYGTWPEQQRKHFKLRGVRNTLAKKYPKHSMEASVLAGLEDLTEKLCTTNWKSESGEEFTIDRCLIDAADGNTEKEVYRVCRTSKHKNVLLASIGRGIKPGDKQMHEYVEKEGEKIGNHWLIAKVAKFASRKFVVDTNFWKSAVHRGLSAPIGEKNSISLFGQKGEDHQMFGEHCRSEKRTRLKSDKTTRQLDFWTLKPGQDNHLFDLLSNAAAAASERGITVVPRKKPPKPKQRREEDNSGVSSLAM